MRPYELIKLKREGKSLEAQDIQALLRDYVKGVVPDYQLSALLMAVYFRGFDRAELEAWTRAMLHSGQVLEFPEVSGVKVDKHSTGGVGDKVSLSLAPLVAACGVPVPMMSGRGLGHTGGTLDKLETIPGFRSNLTFDECHRLMAEEGLALMGQTENLVPADKRLYALRDVTATVDCLPLIASSIMSKKIAEGMDALVLDVKIGGGAFLKSPAEARELAKTMISLGAQFDRRVVALLTDMEQPLGQTVGNALELREAVEVLRGEGPPDVTELTLVLGAEMLVLGKVAADTTQARAALERAVESGAGLKKLMKVVEKQGGDPRVLETLDLLPRAQHQRTVTSEDAGFVTAIDAEAVGLASVGLGAGRAQLNSRIDPAVGFILWKKVGDPVQRGEPLAQVDFNDEALGEAAFRRLQSSYRIGSAAPTPRHLIVERLSE
jgi:pyrimidine-nucleoside phosphorylase